MLGRMRKHAKALGVTLWLVVFAFIGTTFLVYGFRSTSSGRGGPASIATVEGEKIAFSEYQQIYEQQVRQYQSSMGDKFDEKILERLNLKEMILEQLISRHLLLQEARRLRITITPDELAAEITRLPYFMDKDGFSRDRYLRVLESARLTPEKFEGNIREELIVRKLEELVKGGVNVLPEEVREAFRFNRSSVKAEYLLFSDPKAQQATVQDLVRLVKERKSWEEIVKASGIKPVSTGFFSWSKELKEVPEQETFKEVALALDKGGVSPVIQMTKASFIIRVSDRKDASSSEFEQEKQQFSRGLLKRKRDQVYADWTRQVRARSKVTIDRANL